MESSSSGDIYASTIVSFSFAFEQARDFTELTTNFFNHFVSSFTNGFHGHSAEYERKGCTDEQTNQSYGVQEVDGFQTNNLCISGEQCQCGQSCGTDSKTFTDSSGGVTYGVKFVSDFTNFVGEFGHFCDTTSVVSDRTISVYCYGQTSGGEHTNCSQGDTKQAHLGVLSAAHGEEGKDYTDADEYHRQEAGIHTYSQTGDDGGCRTSFRLLSDFLNRTVISRSVNFGDFTDSQTANQTRSDGNESSHATEDGGRQVPSSSNYKDTTNIGAVVKSSLRIGGFAVTSKYYADDGSNDTSQGKHEYEFNAFATGICNSTEGDSRDDCTNIGFEQVSTHTSNVAYVIAYVVSDGSRVTRIVFRDTSFYFTYQVSAYVSSFGVDTAANTSEQCDRRCTQTEAGYNVNVAKQHVSYSNTGDAQANYAQAHYSAAGESDFQSFRHAMTSSFSSTNVSFGCNRHTNVACADGEDCACDEANSSQRREECSDYACNYSNENCQVFVLTVQESHSAFVDIACNFLHTSVTSASFCDTAAEHQSECQCSNTNNDGSH